MKVVLFIYNIIINSPRNLFLLLIFSNLVSANDFLDKAAAQEFIRQQEQGRALREQLEKSSDIHFKSGGDVQDDFIVNETPCFIIHKVELVGSGAKLARKHLTSIHSNKNQ